jgi:uncharacterized protein YprB with RNaseH-like and TPR domain
VYDGCCEFDPQSWNHTHCTEHQCKRKAENAKKRLSQEVTIHDPEVWELQDKRKFALADKVRARNEWILQNRSFAMFDIETTNLDASIGMILCACVKVMGGETFTAVSRIPDGGYMDDHKTVVTIRDWLESYDYVCTYYGTGFDLPYLNTRLLIHGERPINRIRHVDLYYTAKFQLKLHSNRLAVVAETLFGTSDKTRVLGPVWTRAAQGDPKAMEYIVEHCQIDVEVLERVFNHLRGFVNLSEKRIKLFGRSY